MSALLGIAAAAAFSWALFRTVSLPRALRPALALLGALAVFSAVGTIAMLWKLPALPIDFGLLAAALLTFSRAPAPPRDAAAPKASWEKRAFAVACAVAGLALVSHLVRFPDGGNDAFIIWNLRALWFFRAGGDFAGALSPEILFWAHPNYPLLLPSLVARGFSLVGRESLTVPAAVAVLFTASAIAVVVSGAPASVRWLAGLAVATTPALVMQGATQQADVPVAAFVGAAAALLLVRKRGDAPALAAAGAFASMAAWTKNEGSLYLLLLGLAVLLDERRLKPALAFLGGALPMLALLIVFKVHFAPPNTLLPAILQSGMGRALSPDRLGTLLFLALRRLILLQAWGLHLAGLVLATVLALRFSRAPAHARALSWFPAAALAVHLGILLGQVHDLTFIFKVTIDRLLLHLWPAALLLLAWRDPTITSLEEGVANV